MKQRPNAHVPQSTYSLSARNSQLRNNSVLRQAEYSTRPTLNPAAPVVSFSCGEEDGKADGVETAGRERRMEKRANVENRVKAMASAKWKEDERPGGGDSGIADGESTEGGDGD